MKIVNMKKFIRMVLILIGIIAIFAIMFVSKSYSKGEVKEKTIFVSNGDTLWNIASQEQETNNYYSYKDIRDIVYDIRKLNNLDNSETLKIGQKLVIKSL